jgi:hypothetical protein
MAWAKPEASARKPSLTDKPAASSEACWIRKPEESFEIQADSALLLALRNF